MEDNVIVELYFSRNEKAIAETDKKYGKYCKFIAYNILQNNEDTKECVNDAYLNTWNAIPPQRPSILKAFLGKITRNLAINRYERKRAQKRNETLEMALEELNECISSNYNIQLEMEYRELVNRLNSFLLILSRNKRKIFIERYWYLNSIKNISLNNKMSESNVKTTLLRIRNQLKNYLRKGGLYE